MDINKESVALHRKLGGKLAVTAKCQIKDRHDLSLVYTPGVAQVCKEVAEDDHKSYDLTIRGNSIAVVSDGSAVLGLGNIGPTAALPVMEGKAVLFKTYAGIDAFPLCIDTQDSQEIIRFVKQIAPTFAGINLEDIAAPRCFEIERALQDIGIPVFHDDQHGTAIVVLAALINAARLTGKRVADLRVAINGAGAAGTAIVEQLLCEDHDRRFCEPVKEIFVCDSRGLIHQGREDIVDNPAKKRLAVLTNQSQRKGDLAAAVKNVDVFIGVSKAGLLKPEMVQSMADKPIILALANPVPEIMPDEAKKAGAFIVGTGRSDFPNQVNNLLAFPGIFRGALNARAKRITSRMRLAAAYALADWVDDLNTEHILPSPLDKSVALRVADAVSRAACKERESLAA
ncbi:NAD(P)-dependent malic enzyme [Magnetococcales bacterium HHB-1]